MCMIAESSKNPRIPCGHEFCLVCLRQWSYVSSTCPLCKCEFLPENVESNCVQTRSQTQWVSPEKAKRARILSTYALRREKDIRKRKQKQTNHNTLTLDLCSDSD